MEGIRFGTDDNKAYEFADYEMTETALGGVYTIIDTAASDIYISALYYKAFITQLMEEAGVEDYEIKDGEVFTQCDPGFPELQFIFNGYDFPLLPEDYVQDISTGASGTNCRLRLVSINAPFNIVGTTLLLDYYVGFS